MSTKVLTASYMAQEREDRYLELESLIVERVAALRGPLFVAQDRNPIEQDQPNASGFRPYFYAYCNLPEGRRQTYNCNACRRFLDTYGSLVSVSAAGDLVPVLLDPEGVPPLFRKGFAVAHNILRQRGRVADVFVSAAEVWGQPVTDTWTHLHGCPDRSLVFDGTPAEAGQRRAQLRQDYILMKQSLTDFPTDLVYQAFSLLRNGTLPRAEKSLEMAQWLLGLLDRLKDSGTRGPRRDNLVWLATATAPLGFAHFRNTVLGTLLDDLREGRDPETVRRNWAAKLDPLKYQRPVALKEGQLARAEKVIADLKAAGSLRRRFATQADVLSWIWRRPDMGNGWTKEDGTVSVFGHLKPRRGFNRPEPKVSGHFGNLEVVTWAKFLASVLSDKTDPPVSVEVLVPRSRAAFYALTTAADPAAPPLLQWDGLTATSEIETLPPQTVTEPLPRNPVGWYFYGNGSEAFRWGLAPGSWARVEGIHFSPSHWQRPGLFNHHPRIAFFNLEGCLDVKYERGGLFFPESLRNDFREVRAAMEAYANQTPLEKAPAGTDGLGDANGVAFQSGIDCGTPGGLVVRVRRRRGAVEVYKLDRWD